MFLFRKIGRKISILLLLILSVITIIIIKYPQIFSNLIKNSNKKSVTLPAGFPDTPVYPNATLMDSNSEMRKYGEYLRGTWSSNDSVPTISSWYSKALKDNGWVIDIEPADYNASDIQYIVALKNNVTLQLSITKNNEDNTVRIDEEIQPKYDDENNN